MATRPGLSSETAVVAGLRFQLEIAIGLHRGHNDLDVEYLALDQVRERAAECWTELKAPLAVKALAGKPRARQWNFLRDVPERLFIGHGAVDPSALAPYLKKVIAADIDAEVWGLRCSPGSAYGQSRALIYDRRPKVTAVQGKDAILRTTEYWYLRWWRTKEQSYVYP